MDCIDNFRNGMCEFDTLINYAKRNLSQISRYQLFIKVSIVLLSTKLEVFIEEFMEEHSTKMLREHTNISLPQDIKNEYLNRAVELITKEKKQNKKDLLFQSLYILLRNTECEISIVDNIKPQTSFSYGKHGQNEIESLFTKHGLGDFIKSTQSQNCLKIINSLISIRNNVIHQDASPGITHQTIIDHKKNILKFIDMLEQELDLNKQKYYNDIPVL